MQENRRKVSLNELNVLYSKLLKNSGQHIVAGLGISTLAFMRSNFQRGTGAPASDAATGAILVVYPGAISEDSINVVVNIGYGFQLLRKLMLSTSLELQYKKRPETHGIAVTGGIGRIPEVTIWNMRISAGVEWNY